MADSCPAAVLKPMLHLRGEEQPVLGAMGTMKPTTPTIVIVEDDGATRRFLADNLAADGYEPVEARSAAEGRRLLAGVSPELAIIDLGLPDRDGLELLAEVRSGGERGARLDPHLPVLILSGRAAELDRVRGFERGCDDYVVKPFSYSELRARLAALQRRGQARLRLGRVRVGELEIDPLSREVWVGGQRVELSKKEFALLRALAGDPSRVFTREELLRGVWNFQAMGATRTLDSHASRLRKKLSVGGQAFVVNVWGIGYRLVDGEIST
jgi:DNA-binding response OmpR family regulator